MQSALKRHLLAVLVVALAALVYAGSANAWRRPQGAPLNVLHLCQDGVRFQAAGPLLGTQEGLGLSLGAEGARIMVGAERVSGFSLYTPLAGEKRIAPVRALDPDILLSEDLFDISPMEEGDERHLKFAVTPEVYRTTFVSLASDDPNADPGELADEIFEVQQIATYTMAWSKRQKPGTFVNLLVGIEGRDGNPRPRGIGHGGANHEGSNEPHPLAYEAVGQVQRCSLPALSTKARMVGEQTLRGDSRHETCRERSLPQGVQTGPAHAHVPGGHLASHDAEVPQGRCPRKVDRRALKGAFAFVGRCGPAREGEPVPAGPFKLRLDNGQTFRLTDVYGVSCADYSRGRGHGHHKARFDTQYGNGAGKLGNGTFAYAEWWLHDGGPGGADDWSAVKIRRQLCEPGGTDTVLVRAPICDPDAVVGSRLFELNDKVFGAVNAPPRRFPGSFRRTGFNSALPRH